MKSGLFTLLLGMLVGSSVWAGEKQTLFDGKTFTGWTGDTNRTWRIERGELIGGSLKTKVPQNEFLATQKQFTNFVLKVQCRLLGTEGFINGGVQLRSQRVSQPPNEMRGYQADIGEGWWGALYDETRRNKVLIAPDPAAVKRAIKKGEWNEYLIRCEGNRIQTWINGVEMIDYREADAEIPLFGLIGFQVHGGGAAEVHYKDIELETLP